MEGKKILGTIGKVLSSAGLIEVTEDESEQGKSTPSEVRARVSSGIPDTTSVTYASETVFPTATQSGPQCEGYFEAFIETLKGSGGEDLFLFMETVEGLKAYIEDPAKRFQAALDTLGKTRTISANQIAADSTRILKVLRQTLEKQLASSATEEQRVNGEKEDELKSVTRELSQLQSRIGALTARQAQLQGEIEQNQKHSEDVKNCLVGAAGKVEAILTEIGSKIIQFSEGGKV